jgi:hypothetical protein
MVRTSFLPRIFAYSHPLQRSNYTFATVKLPIYYNKIDFEDIDELLLLFLASRMSQESRCLQTG